MNPPEVGFAQMSDDVRRRFVFLSFLTAAVMLVPSSIAAMQFCERKNGIVVMRVGNCHRREKQVDSPFCECGTQVTTTSTSTTSTTLPTQCVRAEDVCNCQNFPGTCFPEVVGGVDSGRFVCTDPTTFDLSGGCQSPADCRDGFSCLDLTGRPTCALKCVPCGLEGNRCHTDADCCSGMDLHCTALPSDPSESLCR